MKSSDRKARLTNLEAVRDAYTTRNPRIPGWPPLLMVEPSSRCTYACPLCPISLGRLRRDIDFMPFPKYQVLLENAYPFVCSLNLWNYGEPFLHPAIVQMFRLAHSMDIETICSTNGFWLPAYQQHEKEQVLESGLDTLVVALDGASPETHSTYRVGSDFDALIAGLADLLRVRREIRRDTPSIELQFIVMKHNAHEIDAVVALAKRLGVNRLTFKSVNLMIGRVPYGPRAADGHLEYIRNSRDYLPDVPALHRYQRAQLASHLDGTCARLWQMIIVNSDGRASVCWQDFNGWVVRRNAFVEDLTAIWNADEYVQLRRKVAGHDRSTLPLCTFCTEGTSSIIHSLEFGEHAPFYLKQQWLQQRIQEESACRATS